METIKGKVETLSEPSFDEMVDKGIGFYISHIGPSGHYTVPISAEHVSIYCMDPPAYLAGYYGVTRSEYLEWHSSEYSVQCAGKRKDGKRCRGIVPGGFCVEKPKEWVRLQGEYCHVHSEGN